MSYCRGFSLMELLLVVGLLIGLASAAIPAATSGLDQMRTSAAARHVAARLQLARMEALKRCANVGMQFVFAAGGYRYAFYVDGNGNGVLSADILRQVDSLLGFPERLDDQFPGVRFGIIDGITAVESTEPLSAYDDPIRIGRSRILSFSPIGTATSGTLYVRGRGQHQYAVRVLGGTGRTRVLRFDFSSRKWISR
jgi:type II secretory pathway pseudopilin PulG